MYPDVSWCISNVSYMLCYIRREYMYLDILHVSQRSPRYIFGIHIRYNRIHVSCALPWCHTGYISGYIKIRVSWTLHHDTSRYIKILNHDTCILDASSGPRWIHTRYAWGYMQDTCMIHARLIKDKCICIGSRIHEEYMRDTSKIHARYMYLILSYVSWEVRIWDAGYMRDTCEIHVSARVIKIHAGYIQDTWWDTCISNASRERCIWYEGDMRDTCKIHAGYMYPQR